VNATQPNLPKTCEGEGGGGSISMEDFMVMMEDIVLDSVDYGIYVDESRWMAKQRVYEALKADSNYVDSSLVLQNFYDSTCPAGIRITHTIEDSIDAGNYFTAQTLAASYVPTNGIETNYQTYYAILLKYVTTGICDSSDSTTLNQLAWKCLFIDGPSVSKARILFNSIFRQQFTVFDDNCRTEGEGGGGVGEEQQRHNYTGLKVGEDFLVTVYPNPATKGFYLKSNCKENCTVKIVVSSLMGQKLIEKTCNLQEGNCFVNTDLANGTYMVSITKTATNEFVNRKLIITK